MIFDLFSKTFDVDIHSPGVADVFVSPDLIEKLFSCKHLIRRSCKEIQKLQLLWRHIHVLSIYNDRVVRQVDRNARIFDAFPFGNIVCLRFGRLIPAQNGFYPGNEFLRIKRFDNIVVRTNSRPSTLSKTSPLAESMMIGTLDLERISRQT